MAQEGKEGTRGKGSKSSRGNTHDAKTDDVVAVVARIEVAIGGTAN